MCQSTNELKLCSCNQDEIDRLKKEVFNYKSTSDKKHYLWSLRSYVGFIFDFLDGLIIFPSEKLDDVITSDFILSQINSKNCFDFEYNPSEGDCLIIHNLNFSEGYLEFIYKGAQWEKDYYNPLTHQVKQIKEGRVELNNLTG